MGNAKALIFSLYNADFPNKNQYNKIKYFGRQPVIKGQLKLYNRNKLFISGMVCEIFIKEEKFDHVLKTRVDHEEKISLNVQNLESRKA